MSTSAPKSCSFRRVARVSIEFTTSFHVGTGEGGYGADALVVTDVNGLPAIPGSSLAGVLRAAFLGLSRDHRMTEALFGHQTNDQGQGSRLSISWAAIHNHNNQPVEGLLPRACLEADPVLQQALGITIRDHVRIGHRGAAEHRGKFDEQPVAAGHRFTFELELVDGNNDADWKMLLSCLARPELRLGGKSRRGYGAFRVVQILEHSFNLGQSDEFQKYCQHPASLAQPAPALVSCPVPSSETSPSSVVVELHIKPRGYWMFGGGDDLPPQDADPADMAPLREDRIVWVNSTGRVEEKRLLLPGSAIKGAIRHRVTFHHNRLEGQFANHLAKGCNNDEQGHQDAQTKLRPVTGLFNQAVCDLFGFVPDKHDGDKREDAARGRVLIDDLFWSGTAPHQQRIPHVSIDRFTGGASDGRLFDERPLWKGDSFPTLKLTILNADDVPAGTRKALKAALDDLANGRLALGAGGGRGLGFFEPNDKPENAVTCTPTGWFDSADGESSQNPANPDAASPANLQPAPSHAH